MNKQLIIPAVLILAMIGVFALRGDPNSGRAMHSALIGEVVPDIRLEAIGDYPGPFNPSALGGDVVLINIWGSWCTFCLYEHPTFLKLKDQGVPIYGLAWNDTPEAAAQWLDRHGSPYEAVGLDSTGLAASKFQITGAPETFVVDAQGVVRHRHVGVLNERAWKRTIKPLMDELRNDGAQG